MAVKLHIDGSKLCITNKLIKKSFNNTIKYYLNDDLHNPNGIAYTGYRVDGSLRTIQYYSYGRLHRTDGPALIFYWSNGNVELEAHYVNGVPTDCNNNPYKVNYYDTGELSDHQYYTDGYCHRTDGPAFIDFWPSGKVKSVIYFIHGIMYAEGEYNQRLRELGD